MLWSGSHLLLPSPQTGSCIRFSSRPVCPRTSSNGCLVMQSKSPRRSSLTDNLLLSTTQAARQSSASCTGRLPMVLPKASTRATLASLARLEARTSIWSTPMLTYTTPPSRLSVALSSTRARSAVLVRAFTPRSQYGLSSKRRWSRRHRHSRSASHLSSTTLLAQSSTKPASRSSPVLSTRPRTIASLSSLLVASTTAARATTSIPLSTRPPIPTTLSCPASCSAPFLLLTSTTTLRPMPSEKSSSRLMIPPSTL